MRNLLSWLVAEESPRISALSLPYHPPKLPRNFSDRRLIVDIDLFPPHTTFILPKSLVTLHFGQ